MTFEHATMRHSSMGSCNMSLPHSFSNTFAFTSTMPVLLQVLGTYFKPKLDQGEHLEMTTSPWGTHNCAGTIFVDIVRQSAS